MMRCACTMAAAAAALLGLAAAAQAKPTVRAGVPVDSLTPTGMQRVRVRAPAVESQPVRLTYAEPGAAKAVLLVDVVVGADAAAARTALDHWRHQLSREIGTVEGIGDVAFGTSGTVGFVRDNVMVVVRRVSGDADIAALAAHAVSAVAAAPKGTPRPSAVTAAVPKTLVAGESYDVTLSSAVLAADVRAEGPARIRRTADGWKIRRTAAGDVTVSVVSVDELLRVNR